MFIRGNANVDPMPVNANQRGLTSDAALPTLREGQSWLTLSVRFRAVHVIISTLLDRDLALLFEDANHQILAQVSVFLPIFSKLKCVWIVEACGFESNKWRIRTAERGCAQLPQIFSWSPPFYASSFLMMIHIL
ncbi:hypothetical protein Y032_0003g1664 [Ancylostoma ceylanicum]|uniref:Uncharacterized protein n=1 Tax=Ancylostoma ceylanicum TaxID=53326 RepID=A0A016VYX5_9BILA|nr:hypothetical protein Y032_0003g1664 [Ancylostoma ceylanicum]